VDDAVHRLSTALESRYRIERELGAGGMATVWLAEDLKHDRQVALKVVRPDRLGPGAVARFRAEIRTTAKLNHPNILPLFDSGEVEGSLFYVMPLVAGETLKQRLDREGQLSLLESGRIAAAAARALAHAHENGVIHRDVKPSNLMLHLGQTLVSDFGISLVTGTDQRMTATGVSLGTPYYMSPEQLDESRDPDGRADQYSLGCVLFEMLEGQPPFPKRSAHAALVAHLTQAPPHLTSSAREAAALDMIVQQALAKDPADRYPTMSEFADAIEEALAPAPAPDGSPRRGLVVLPFTNMSPDPDDAYFSDGLTEEVIADLSRIRGLRVISRTTAMHYRNTSLRLSQIADELNVAFALEGGVRKAGNRIRVSAQLIDAHSEQHLWSDKYDGVVDDIFEIQDRVSSAIADALSIVLTPEERQAIVDRRLPDAEALQLYMKAQHAVWSWSAGPLMDCIAELERVLAGRGDHLQLLRGLAYLRWQVVNFGISADPIHLQTIDEYVRRMEALEPGTPWAAAMTGITRQFRDLEHAVLNLLEAYRGGIRDDPDLLGWLCLGCVCGGHAEAGERFAAELMAIDPHGNSAIVARNVLAFYRGRFAEASEIARELPDSWFKVALRAWCEVLAERNVVALSILDEIPDGDGGYGRGMANLMRAVLEQRVDDAASIANDLGKLATGDYQGAMFLGEMYAKVGDRASALQWLRHAVGMGAFMPDFLMRYDSALADLRDDPEFKSIVRSAQLGSIRVRAAIDRLLAPISPARGDR
jgi:eukaryotic-like serine/threonine-protein kinase